MYEHEENFWSQLGLDQAPAAGLQMQGPLLFTQTALKGPGKLPGGPQRTTKRLGSTDPAEKLQN